jgi:hypothetical protein
MPRHPPIALKTLDRSHCQCPSRNPEGIVARTRSCAEPDFNGIGTKRPASRDLSRGAVRLTHHGREIERLTATNQGHQCAKPAGNNRGPHSCHGVRTNLLFTMSIQNPQAAEAARKLMLRMISSPPSRHQPQRFGGAGRDRTDDILLAKQALSQLSYGP